MVVVEVAGFELLCAISCEVQSAGMTLIGTAPTPSRQTATWNLHGTYNTPEQTASDRSHSSPQKGLKV